MVIRGILDRVATARLARALPPSRDVETIRLGSEYGGWVIPKDLVNSDSIVYSGGVGEDVSFDLELIDRTGCHVWAFDPTPRAIEFAHQVDNPNFHFKPVGLWAYDSVQRFWSPTDPSHVSHSVLRNKNRTSFFDADCRSVNSLMREFGHDKVDLLKLDIEGAEYDLISSLGDLTPPCICVEVHPIMTINQIVEFVKGSNYDVANVEGWVLMLLPQDR